MSLLPLVMAAIFFKSSVSKSESDASCCTAELVDFAKSSILDQGDFSLAIGNSDGPCCVIDGGLAPDKVISIASASKMVTGYIILRLIDKGLLTLDTRAADVLDWWTSDADDMRSTVTVHQLLAQTDGLGQFNIIGNWDMLGACTAWDTIGCAKQGYRNFKSTPGEKFRYSETSFYVLGAIAMKVTGHSVYDSVFREIVANPLKMGNKYSSEGSCVFDKGSLSGKSSLEKTDPGGGLSCTLNEYSKFLRTIFAQEFVSAELHREAETVQTINASNMPYDFRLFNASEHSHYALGAWRECMSDECPDSDGIKIHSMGAWGFYPWIWRKGNESHWGILARTESMFTSFALSQGLVPLATTAMEQFNTRANNSNFTFVGKHQVLLEDLVSGAPSKWGVQVAAAFLSLVACLLMFD